MTAQAELSNRLKVLRAERDLTQAELARRVAVTRKTINTVERGVFVPSTVLALKLAHELGVPVEEIFHLAVRPDTGDRRSTDDPRAGLSRARAGDR